MDLVAACRAFVAVVDAGSFTSGAAAARMAQSVASRRVAALETHLGLSLLDRSARQVRLTADGAQLLPVARRLVGVAEAVEDAADRRRDAGVRCLVPEVCSSRRLAELQAAARHHDLVLEICPALPEERARALNTPQDALLAVLAVPTTEAEWITPLGAAGQTRPDHGALLLESLRPARRAGSGPPPRLWIQPEDAVAHIRDPLRRLAHQLGLTSAQIREASSTVAALAAVLDGRDLLLCSPQQADDLGLFWRPLKEVSLQRGHRVEASAGLDASPLRSDLRRSLAAALGAKEIVG